MDTAALEIAWIAFCLALPLSIAGANIGWGLVLLALAVSAWRKGRMDWRGGRSDLLLPVGVYCAVALLTSSLGTDPAHSLRFLNQDLHKAWLCFLFALGLSNLRLTTERRMLAALAAGFTALACVGFYQIAAGLPHIARPHGFVHPVTFGEMTVLASLGAFAFAWRPPENWPRGRRFATWGLLGLLTVIAFLNQTRGALLGAVVAVVLLPLVDLKFLRLSLAGGLLAAAVLLGSDLIPNGRSLIRAVSRESGQTLANDPQLDRFKLWRIAWDMFRDHPWTGVGDNNYRAHSPRYFTGIINGEPAMGSAHNLYLHQLAERGIVGGLALVFLFWTLWRRSLNRARHRPDAWNLWAFAATAAFTAMNLTEVALQTEQLWILFFFIWIWAEKHDKAYA